MGHDGRQNNGAAAQKNRTPKALECLLESDAITALSSEDVTHGAYALLLVVG